MNQNQKQETMIEISNKQRFLEITAVLITAAGKFLFMDYLNWRFPFVAGASLFWICYVIYQSRRNKEILAYWGFRKDNFKKVLSMVLPFGLFAIAAFFAVGFYQGTINMTWHLIPILIMYPIWGTIQQFLLISLLAGNLQDMEGKKFNKAVIILFAAILFAAVHYPFWWLIGATFVLALFYGYVYLKARNLYVLGLFHGWLGGLFYYTVLNQDPFMDTFGKFL